MQILSVQLNYKTRNFLDGEVHEVANTMNEKNSLTKAHGRNTKIPVRREDPKSFRGEKRKFHMKAKESKFYGGLSKP